MFAGKLVTRIAMATGYMWWLDFRSVPMSFSSNFWFLVSSSTSRVSFTKKNRNMPISAQGIAQIAIIVSHPAAEMMMPLMEFSVAYCFSSRKARTMYTMSAADRSVKNTDWTKKYMTKTQTYFSTVLRFSGQL